MRKVGKKVKGGIKKAKPGDIICYSGHVAIYMGKNKKIVHASNSAPYPRGGITNLPRMQNTERSSQ